jgi:hypothetical protein
MTGTQLFTEIHNRLQCTVCTPMQYSIILKYALTIATVTSIKHCCGADFARRISCFLNPEQEQQYCILHYEIKYTSNPSCSLPGALVQSI